ncbi:hypothetical protein SAMN05443544_1986 [Agromyces cerinus subsp. cerinus]|uniref:Uncharacterized protein n=1 Tax=Agromyces cerinus subsp. cerinus TaxID=232089 RepID=A0A1N6FES8_9MICO|nr:hypothetical protein SAMN05443544_1986 [Agromyces cerinus subsp. cerinus]
MLVVRWFRSPSPSPLNSEAVRHAEAGVQNTKGQL